MRAGTEAMLRQKLRHEAAKYLKEAARSIERGNWQSAYIELSQGLGYVNDLDPSDEFFNSVVHFAGGGDRDYETNWKAYMEGSDDDA